MTEAFLKSLELAKVENGYYANIKVFNDARDYVKNGGDRSGLPLFRPEKNHALILSQNIEGVQVFIHKIYENKITEPIPIELLKKCLKDSSSENNQQQQNTPQPQAAPKAAPVAPKEETKPTQPEVQPANNQQQPPQQRPRRVPKKQQPEAPPVVQETNKSYTIEDGILSFQTAQFSEEVKKEFCRVLGISPALGFSTIEFQII